MKRVIAVRCAISYAVGCGLLLSAMAFAADPASRPTTKPTTKATSKPSTTPSTHATSRPAPTGRRSPESKASDDALKAAIAELTKEAQETFRKKDAELPRKESDYFKGKSPGIEQDGLLAALNKSLSQDPRIDAYIKLQLLSAIDKFDEEHAKPAILALVGAPALVPLPGMGSREQQEWNRKSQNIKEADVSKVNGEFKAAVAAAEANNAPMIAYRNALKEKIKVDEAMKVKLLQARVEEMSQRAAAGFDTFTLFKDLSSQIQAWAATATKKDIIAMQAFLKDYSRRTGPSVYEELKWSTSVRNLHAYWKDHDAVLDAKRMKSLLDALKTAEANAI